MNRHHRRISILSFRWLTTAIPALSLLAGCTSFSKLASIQLPLSNTETTFGRKLNDETATLPATLGLPEFDVIRWSNSIEAEMAHNAHSYREQRIVNQILPELDRLGKALTAGLLHVDHDEFMNRKQLIERVRKQWTDELKVTRDCLEKESSTKS